MNIIQKIQSLRAAFESATQKFADYQLGDLTVRIGGEVAVGTPIALFDAEGNPIDATGEHDIPSIGKVVVTNGVIESVTPAPVEEVVAEEVVAPEEVAAPEAADAAAAVEEVAAVVEEIAPEAPAEEVAAISAEAVAEIMAKLGSIESEMNTIKEELGGYKDREKKMFEAIEQLGKLPTAPEVTGPVIGKFKKDEADRFDKLAQTLKTLKTK
jgi:pyruvate/2-oxoglutarate dehydrogenase complex dihydrolipoamide acyltransferase (E2) component